MANDEIINLVVMPKDGLCEGCGEPIGEEAFETDDMMVLCNACWELCVQAKEPLKKYTTNLENSGLYLDVVLASEHEAMAGALQASLTQSNSERDLRLAENRHMAADLQNAERRHESEMAEKDREIERLKALIATQRAAGKDVGE